MSTEKIIYWKAKSKKSIGDYCPLPGDWVCKDRRVKSFRIFAVGHCNAKVENMSCSGRAQINFKNGTQWMGKEYYFKMGDAEKTNQKIVSQAIKYLKSLP